MMFNTILLTKLLIIIVILLFLPAGYFFLRISVFSLIMSQIFDCRMVNFYVLFYLYKIILIFFILNLLLFLAVTIILLLITLINLGIIY